MVEVICQGASFTSLPAANPPRLRSPCVELWVDGCRVAKTKRHDRGDRQPRWGDERFTINAAGQTLAFRVLVGNAPEEQLCGEGFTDLQSVLSRSVVEPNSVSLLLGGQSTGVLWFVVRQATQQVPLAYGQPANPFAQNQTGNLTPRTAANVYREITMKRDQTLGYAQTQAQQTTFAQANLADQQRRPSHPQLQPGDFQRRLSNPQAQPQIGDFQQRSSNIQGQALAGAAYNGATAPNAAWDAWGDGLRLPIEALHQKAQGADPAGGRETTPRKQRPNGEVEEPAHTGTQLDARRTSEQHRPFSARNSTGETIPANIHLERESTAEKVKPRLERHNTRESTGSQRSASPRFFGKKQATTPGGRLNITERGREEIEEMMASKDKMREVSKRPFLRLGKESIDATLNFHEFQAALSEILQDAELSPPNEEQMQALFDKHQRNGKGLGIEEFEALLFRLLCFMRASKEVTPTASRAPVQRIGGEERDKHWREEFIQRNSRRFEEVYESIKELGKGSFGTVYKVAHRTQRNKQNQKCIRVCKIIGKAMASKAGTSNAKVREELAVLKQLDHPHVLRIFEDFEDDENFYLIMEPCWGGDIQDYVKDLPAMNAQDYEFWVAKVMYHTLSAIAYCHSKGVIHKDLKPENVMMSTAKDSRGYAPTSEMHVVVVDFGLAEVFSDPKDTSRIVSGTPPYMAPEVWAGNFNKSCDIWSCGVMLFFLLSGRLPFVAHKLEDFPRAVAAEPDWAMMGGASQDAHELCRKMLIKRQERRPSAPEVLRERWFVVLGLTGLQKLEKPPLEKPQLNTLMKINERTEFEKFVMRLVATQVDASEQKQVNEAFKAFDTDGDGLLSREELRQGLLKMGKASADVDKVVDAMDVGHTGRISYSEFLAGAINLRSNKKEEQDKLLWTAWQAFSPDEQGRVKIASVQESLAARGMTVVDLPESFLAEMQRGGKASDDLTFESFKKLFAEDKTWRDKTGKIVDFVDNMTGGAAQNFQKRVSKWFSKK